MATGGAAPSPGPSPPVAASPEVAATPEATASPEVASPEVASTEVASSGAFTVRERVASRPDAVTLEVPGAEPRTPLSLGGAVGDVRTLQLRLGMAVAMQMGTRDVPDTAVPTLTIGLRVETTAVETDGATLAIAVTSVDAAESAEATVRVREAMARTAERMRSTRGTLRLAPDGRVLAFDLEGQPASAAGPTALEPELGGLVAALQELLPAVPPADAVGDGARWTSIRHVRRDAVRLEQVGTWTLSRPDPNGDAVLSLRSEHVGTTDPAAAPGMIEATSGTTVAELVLGAGALPRRATATVQTQTRANLELIGAAQVVSMRTTLTLELQDAPP